MIFFSKTMNLNIKNAVAYLTFKELDKIPFISHSFSTRIGGVSKECFRSLNMGFKTKDSIDNIYENYKLFCESTNSNRESMSFLNQVHSTNIKNVLKENISQIENFDASITNIPGITLVTFHADCVPIYVIDPIKKSIGLAHAGWRGTVNGISEKLVDQMCTQFGSNPQDLICFIGPSIHKCCFEIQEDIVENFEKIDKSLITRENNKIYADIAESNRIKLIRCKIKEENIISSDLCTKCNSDLFFSNRAHGNNRGTMIATIRINEEY